MLTPQEKRDRATALADARARERQAKAEEAKGNLVFRDEAGKPVAVLDTSNLSE